MRIAVILTLFLVALPMGLRAEDESLIRFLGKSANAKLSWDDVAPLGWNREYFEREDRNKDGYISAEDFWLTA